MVEAAFHGAAREAKDRGNLGFAGFGIKAEVNNLAKARGQRHHHRPKQFQIRIRPIRGGHYEFVPGGDGLLLGSSQWDAPGEPAERAPVLAEKDHIKPGEELARPVKLAQAFPSGDHRLLDKVARKLGIPAKCQGLRHQPWLLRLEQQ